MRFELGRYASFLLVMLVFLRDASSHEDASYGFDPEGTVEEVVAPAEKHRPRFIFIGDEKDGPFVLWYRSGS